MPVVIFSIGYPAGAKALKYGEYSLQFIHMVVKYVPTPQFRYILYIFTRLDITNVLRHSQ